MIRHAAFSITSRHWRQIGSWRRAARQAPAWLAGQLRAERDRWVLWIPVGFGLGIGGYFALPVEPGVALGPAVSVVLATGLLISRRKGGSILAWVAALVVSLGFTTAQVRTALIPDHLLTHPVSGVASGTVAGVEDRPTRPRVILSKARLVSVGGVWLLAKVRISLRSGAALPEIGEVVEIPASLRPPPAPSAPGAYDFRRTAFFNLVSAVGYATGPYRALDRPETADSFGESLRTWLSGYRLSLSRRITEALPGPTGALASALLTGERGPLPEEALKNMRESGLAHLLAISGLHMGLVAGVVFLGLRAVLSLSRRLALRYPVKKWAALGALIFAAAYLCLSGASVPTQRAFMMTGLVLVGVLLDREAISLRLVAWAAMLVLVFRPEALLSASFQLSFAAVTALVATYEWLAARRRRVGWREGGWRGRVLIYLGALLLTSLVANIATLPFSAYHFNRIAAHGLASNMVAVPLTGFWIMPWGVLALALAPFGLEGLALTPMGWGLDLLLRIAKIVSGWPGAVISVAAWPALAPVLIGIAGAWLCLWRKPWRLGGFGAVAAAVLLIAMSPGPKVMVTADGRLAGYLASDGRLMLSETRREKFTAELWGRRAGGVATAGWREVAETSDEDAEVNCDDLGCTLHVNGAMVAVAGSGRALADDCRRATVVITTAFAPACEGPRWVFDQARLLQSGGVVIWADGPGIRVEALRAMDGERPWS